MLVVYVIAIVILVLAVLIAMVRMAKGPSNADRILASDVIVVVVVCGLAVVVVATRSVSALPILVALSLIGFLGAVSVARFLVDRDSRGGR
jgi:multicomponent Na+:H+ antiporter subunit F